MTASECSVGCEEWKAESEGKGALGLESEGDLMGLGDHGHIAHREGKENDGGVVDDSFDAVNRNSDGPEVEDLDLEGKLDQVDAVVIKPAGSAEKGMVVRDQDMSDVMRENGELYLENGHNHEKGVVSIMNSDSMVANDAIKQQIDLNAGMGEDGKLCGEGVNGELCSENGHDHEGGSVFITNSEIEVAIDLIKQQTDADMGAGVEKDEKLCDEKGVNGESHVHDEENGDCCEVTGELCREEEERELSFENTPGLLEESASAVEEEEPNTAVGEPIQQEEPESELEIEEAREPETIAMEADCQEELESAVEEQEPNIAVGDPIQQAELESEVEIEEAGETETVVLETDCQEELELAAEEKEPNAAVGEPIQQAEPELELEVEEAREPETVVMETDRQEELESAVEEKEPNAAVGEPIQQAEPESDVEIEEAREPNTVVVETDCQEESESATESVEEDKAETRFTDTENQRESESAVEGEEEQEPETMVATANDLVEPEPAVEGEEKHLPCSDVTKVDSLEEPKSVYVEGKVDIEIMIPETNGDEDCESVELEEKQEAQAAVTQFNEKKQCRDVGKSDDHEESESIHVEEKQDIEVVVTETDDHEECESVELEEKQEAQAAVTQFDERVKIESVKLEEKQQCRDVGECDDQDIEVVVAETDDNKDLKSDVGVEAKQQPKPLVEEIDGQTELKSADELELKQELETEVIEVEEKREPENVLVETEVLEGDEKLEPLIVITETMAFEPLPVENDVAGTSNGADYVSSEPSNQVGILPVVKYEIVSESGDEKESSNNDEVSSTRHGDSLYNAVLPTDQSVPSEPKVDIPIEVADLCASDPASDMDLKPEFVDDSIRSGIEVDCGLDDSGACSNAEFKDDVCDGVASSDKDEYVGEMKVVSEVNDAESMTSSVEGDRSTSKDDDEEPNRLEVMASNGIQSPHEESCGLALDGERLETHAIKRQPCYMIRIPRFNDDELRTKLQNAQILVDEKTEIRGSICVDFHKQKAIFNEYSEKHEAAKRKATEARAAFGAKRQEVESVQSMINKMKSSSLVDEIDDKIHKIEHILHHETIPSLAQEKQYIKEIKQLKDRRGELCSSMGPLEEIPESFDQRGKVEERFKTLKKELDPLRIALLRAEDDVKTAGKKRADELQLLNGLQKQLIAADVIRQDAYKHLKNLKKESNEKTKHFYRYKDDLQAAANYAHSGNREALQSLCNQQVERTMELWNNNEEFRKQYLKFNVNSTLRRLRTLDGRSLGPGEEPPVLRTFFVDRSSSNGHAPSSIILKPVPVLNLEVREEISAAPAEPKWVQPTNQPAKPKNSTASRVTVKPIVTSNEEVVKEAEKEIKITKEEEELARKAEELARKEEELARKEEELRKEKADIELKEQLRLEQRAKAKEAEERKRRKAEKAQAKAEFKAQKDAELREKKKAKKGRKKSGSLNGTNGGDEGDCAPITDTVPTETTKEPGTAATKASRRSSRPAAAMKQHNKIQPLPLPLRNKGKRKMQTWMWVLLVAVLVVALFLAGNYVSFYQFNLPSFGY